MDEHIRVEINGLVFDSEDPRCAFIYQRSQDIEIAFIKCLDGNNPKFYWGEYDAEMPETSIRKIMRTGGKWGELAKILSIACESD